MSGCNVEVIGFKKMKVDRESTLNFSAIKGLTPGQEVLCLETKGAIKLIPLVNDIKKIYIEVTTRCNLDCTTCIRNSWRDSLGHMEWETFESILEQIKDLTDLETIHFGGFGEPMSHPRIFDMVKEVKALGLKVEMISNGCFVDDEVAEKLIALDVDTLIISLDGPDEEAYGAIRIGTDLKTVLDNIEKLNQAKKIKKVLKPALGIEFVATKSNYHKLPNLVKLVEKLQARFLLVTNVLPYSEEMKDEIVYDLDDTGVMDGWQLMLQARMPQMQLRTERYCRFIENNSLTITWEGNVSPCYSFMHSYDAYIYGRKKEMKPYHLGNVKEKTITQIWLNPEYAIFRHNVREYNFPSCTDCKQLDGCSYTDDNSGDCWGNTPSCSECLWARGMIVCP